MGWRRRSGFGAMANGGGGGEDGLSEMEMEMEIEMPLEMGNGLNGWDVGTGFGLWLHKTEDGSIDADVKFTVDTIVYHSRTWVHVCSMNGTWCPVGVDITTYNIGNHHSRLTPSKPSPSVHHHHRTPSDTITAGSP